jgi:hypothetical protein
MLLAPQHILLHPVAESCSGADESSAQSLMCSAELGTLNLDPAGFELQMLQEQLHQGRQQQLELQMQLLQLQQQQVNEEQLVATSAGAVVAAAGRSGSLPLGMITLPMAGI